jgi:phage baseplate assembly protein W
MAEYTQILVPSLDTSNNPTRSEDVKGIIANTEHTFNQSTLGGSGTPFDYIDRNAPDGDFRRIAGVAVLVNSIRNLLSTPRGSYPFDPEYGSNLYQMVFEPADRTTEESIKFETVDRIKFYDDRVKITQVNTEFFNNQKGYRINITIEKDRVQAITSLDFLENSAFVLQEA